MNRTTLLNIVAFFFVALGPLQLHAGPVAKRIENQIKTDVVQAYRQDDWRSFEKILTNWVNKFDAAELDEIDVLLESSGAPPVGRLLLDARMAEMLSGGTSKKTHPREFTRSIPVLHEQIEQMVRDAKDSRFFEDILPEFDEMQDYHDAFWELHVAKNELATAKRLARYGRRIVEQAKSSKMKGLSEDEQKVLDADFAIPDRLVEKTLDELSEIRTELQILALGKAAKTVRESTDYKERLRAGYVLAFSAEPVLESLRKLKPDDFDRPLLKDERVLSSVETSVRYARESSGDLITQARLLYLGMHWWMRGRYGQGPDGMGLLKSANALRSNEAQFPLYMPVKPPKPTEPSTSSYGYSVPKFDRRHHYIWMYEYRKIQQNVENQRQRKQTRTRNVTSSTRLDRFY